MIVVADSSPLNYLVLLSHAELLHRFYDQVVVPEAVAAELSSPAAPVAVREWMTHAPDWLSIVPVDAARVLQVTDEFLR
jgi:predicted nucleic acid-binding protein